MINSALYIELYTTLATSLKPLPDKPEETPLSCLYALWHMAAGQAISAASALTRKLVALDHHAEHKLRALVAARLSNKPLAYLTGRQQFMGVELIASPQAVIPRKDTETLAKVVLKLINERYVPGRDCVVVDVFTGSGNIPLVLAKLAPGPKYHGSDLSADAIDLARQNAEYLDVIEHVEFMSGDLLAPYSSVQFQNRVDIVSGAPPFISSSKVPAMPNEISQHEPALAFDAGPYGVSLFVRLIEEAPQLLKSGGWLCFEVGLGQGTASSPRRKNNPVCSPCVAK
ncbi:MAG: peptide chain release factor N(5)-glutamine methyltransferase [Gammaproteobacteria bacterium]|nr:peptide chain release factor N(5)-glutamine methyltransferase [Gammaproteobacteria bacterium]